MSLPDLPDNWQHDDINRVMLRHFPFPAKPRTALDCGAHRGVVTRKLLHHFQEVVAFEPTDLLHQIPKAARKFQTALGARPGVCGMQAGKDNNGQTHVVPGDTFDMTTIDSIYQRFGFGPVDFIKLDVEGMELEVLHGAYDTLCRDKPVIMFEENGLSERYGIKRGVVAAHLRNMGYVCSMVIHKSPGTTEEVYAWPR